MGETIKTIKYRNKRPDGCTPKNALDLINKGHTIPELAEVWGLSRGYIYYLLHQAGWKREAKVAK